jgi:hypothetical protein
MPAAAVGSGRFALTMVPVTGNGNGYYAILLDTQTGRMWSSSANPGFVPGDFRPLHSPTDPYRPATPKPEAAPQP